MELEFGVAIAGDLGISNPWRAQGIYGGVDLILTWAAPLWHQVA